MTYDTIELSRCFFRRGLFIQIRFVMIVTRVSSAVEIGLYCLTLTRPSLYCLGLSVPPHT
jgi:hypothetical protein